MEDNAAKKNLTISVNSEEIVGSEIMRSGDYKYARIGIKKGDSEYMSISYEWKGEGIPEFVLGVMEWIKANKEEVAAKKTEGTEEWAALKERL